MLPATMEREASQFLSIIEPEQLFSSYFPWVYQDESTALGDAVSYLLHVDLSKKRIKALQTLVHVPFESIPRRRQDIGSIAVLGGKKTISSLISYLRYYHANQLPIFVPYSSLENWTTTSIKTITGTYGVSSPWMARWQPEISKNRLLRPVRRNINPLFYAYGHDVATLFRAGYLGVAKERITDTLLGAYRYLPSSSSYRREGSLFAIGAKGLTPLSQERINKIFDRNQNSLAYRRARLTGLTR